MEPKEGTLSIMVSKVFSLHVIKIKIFSFYRFRDKTSDFSMLALNDVNFFTICLLFLQLHKFNCVSKKASRCKAMFLY